MSSQLITVGLSFLSMLCLGTGWFLAGRIAKKLTALQSMFLFQLAGLPFFIFLLPFGSFSTTPFNFSLIFFLGVYVAFIQILLFYSYKIGNLSIVNPIADSYVVFAVIFGILLLNESVTENKVIGTVLVFLGSIFLSFQINQVKKSGKVNLNKGIIPAFFAGAGTGLYFVFVTILARQSGWFINSFGIRLGISLTGFVLLLISKQPIRKIFSNVPWSWVLTGAFLDVIGFSIYNIAVIGSEVSFVTIIISSQTLVIILLSYFFLKERLTKFQIIGLISIILGIITINL